MSAPRAPAVLFKKLNDWGLDTLVIPHGTTWGFYTPLGYTWDKQLRADLDDANLQRLVEVYSPGTATPKSTGASVP